MNDTETQEGQQEPPTATATIEAASFPTCASVGCRRRAEWTATARQHDGTALVTYYACHDTMHQGQAAARARQEREWSVVEIRQITERH